MNGTLHFTLQENVPEDGYWTATAGTKTGVARSPSKAYIFLLENLADSMKKNPKFSQIFEASMREKGY